MLSLNWKPSTQSPHISAYIHATLLRALTAKAEITAICFTNNYLLLGELCVEYWVAKVGTCHWFNAAHKNADSAR